MMPPESLPQKTLNSTKKVQTPVILRLEYLMTLWWASKRKPVYRVSNPSESSPNLWKYCRLRSWLPEKVCCTQPSRLRSTGCCIACEKSFVTLIWSELVILSSLFHVIFVSTACAYAIRHIAVAWGSKQWNILATNQNMQAEELGSFSGWSLVKSFMSFFFFCL